MLVDQRAQVGHRPGCEVKIREILARAKTAARPRDHQFSGVTSFDLIERFAQFLMHRPCEAVQLIGTIERQRGDTRAVVDTDDDRIAVAGHGVSLLAKLCKYACLRY